jgi:hypothetical protein
VISHSFAFRASRRLKFSYKSILPCTAFPSALVSMLKLSPPLPVLLLLRVGGLSRLNTRALRSSTTAKVRTRKGTLEATSFLLVVCGQPPAQATPTCNYSVSKERQHILPTIGAKEEMRKRKSQRTSKNETFQRD